MELKNYQKKVMTDLSEYMAILGESKNLYFAWKEYWAAKDIAIGFNGASTYNNSIAAVPHVCMKVPTGGGKTFMACAAIKKIFEFMPAEKPRVVVWLVPSDSILTQTIRTLSDSSHPYRQRLDADFAGRVGVYTKEMLLNAQNFSPDTVREMLTVCILSYSSLRINSRKKDERKIYQENGNLMRFAEYFSDDSVLLADTPDTALIQVLRHLSPVAVVDESHNAGSDLSVEMLNNLNPSFVLDLTATPRKNSNILSYVDARELKKENMVKLPVVVYNRGSRQSVIQDAIQLRGGIERQAVEEERAGGRYIRPIVLFQAQPNTSGDSETFDKIKKMLTEIGIPEGQIAIKTSKVDDLKDVNLLSRDCQIRYIITVNALKEGWDCPFAYILASLANKTSQVDVEQILGRILRQPYAVRHSAPLLNTSYVLTCSRDFHATLENVVRGLNRAGFSRKDYRIGTDEPQFPTGDIMHDPIRYDQMEFDSMGREVGTADADDSFTDVSTEQIKYVLDAPVSEDGSTISEMERKAVEVSRAYDDELTDADNEAFFGGEEGEMMNQFGIQRQFREEVRDLRIPQFFMRNAPGIFAGIDIFLEKENLSEGFSLKDKDSQISFELSTGEMYRVDIQEQGDAVPKYQRAARDESRYVREFLARLPKEGRIRECTGMICRQINKNNRYEAGEIRDYVGRIVGGMTEDELAAMETAVPVYAAKILKKIESLETVYMEGEFFRRLDERKIFCRANYALPEVITPSKATDAIPYSLYEAEKDDMNDFEHRVIDAVVSLHNIRWWHRIIERKDFRINGFINHYPDFMVMTKSGVLAMVEAKGDYLDGDDSRTKLRLGRTWMAYAGDMYRYFMVFDNKDLGDDGAYTLDGFIEVMREL